MRVIGNINIKSSSKLRIIEYSKLFNLKLNILHSFVS